MLTFCDLLWHCDHHVDNCCVRRCCPDVASLIFVAHIRLQHEEQPYRCAAAGPLQGGYQEAYFWYFIAVLASDTTAMTDAAAIIARYFMRCCFPAALLPSFTYVHLNLLLVQKFWAVRQLFLILFFWEEVCWVGALTNFCIVCIIVLWIRMKLFERDRKWLLSIV